MRVGFVCMIESIFFLHIIKRNANILRADILAKYEETKKELADWVNASPEELADVIAGM